MKFGLLYHPKIDVVEDVVLSDLELGAKPKEGSKKKKNVQLVFMNIDDDTSKNEQNRRGVEKTRDPETKDTSTKTKGRKRKPKKS